MSNSSQGMIDGVRAVIFDVSGTTLDYGSRGPVVAFVELFKRHGVEVSEEEARRPMGAHKKDHLWGMLSDPDIRKRWTKIHGEEPSREKALEQLWAEFPRLQKEVLVSYSDVIPGVVPVVEELRKRGIKIANTTGFDPDMMDGLIEQAAKGGYKPDLWVTPALVGKGRPAPWMAFYAAHKLGVYPMSSFVKVGDTPIDIDEGHNAGMWMVSIVRTGNEVGLSREQLESLPPQQQESLIAAARKKLQAKHPHYLINGVADLMPVIDEISARIKRGERPPSPIAAAVGA